MQDIAFVCGEDKQPHVAAHFNFPTVDIGRWQKQHDDDKISTAQAKVLSSCPPAVRIGDSGVSRGGEKHSRGKQWPNPKCTKYCASFAMGFCRSFCLTSRIERRTPPHPPLSPPIAADSSLIVIPCINANPDTQTSHLPDGNRRGRERSVDAAPHMASKNPARVVRHNAFVSSASRQLLLRATSWRPDTPEKAVLVVAHHFGDHSGKLESYAGVLAASGIAVVGADCQGWGESESFASFTDKNASTKEKSSNYYIKSEDQLVADFDKLVSRVMQFYTVKGADPRFPLSRILKEKLNPWDSEAPIAPKIPVFVLGHGMGAPVVARYLADRVGPDHEKAAAVRGAVLVGPWIGYTPVLHGLLANPLVAEVVHRYFPHTKMFGKEPDPADLFEELEQVVAWERDSVIAKTELPPHTCRVLESIAKQANEVLKDVTLPTLVMRGQEDPLCPEVVAAAVLDHLGSEDKELVEIPDTKHDVFKSSAMTGAMSVEFLCKWIKEKAEGFEAPSDPMSSMEDAKRAVWAYFLYYFFSFLSLPIFSGSFSRPSVVFHSIPLRHRQEIEARYV